MKWVYYHKIYQDIQTYLSEFVELSFKTLSLKLYSKGKNKNKEIAQFEASLQKYIEKIKSIHIANFSGEKEYAHQLITIIKKLLGESVEISTSTDSIKDNLPNISITLPKDYYEDKNIKDPYSEFDRLNTPIQNITIDTKLSDVIVKVILKELVIKCELYGYGAIIKHEHRLDSYKYFAVIDKKQDIFYKSYLNTLGDIEVLLPTNEEQRFLENMMFEIPLGEIPEYVIMSDKGDVVLITKLLLKPLADFNALTKLYGDTTTPYYFSKDEILEMIASIDTYPCDIEIVQEKIRKIQNEKGVSSTKLMALSQTIISKKLRNMLKKRAGRFLRFSPRNAEFKSYFEGMLGINYVVNKNEGYYHTGNADANLNASIDKNSPFRKVVAIQGEIDMTAILPFMEYYFVKNKELTVMPYPLKYAREGYEVYRAKLLK